MRNPFRRRRKLPGAKDEWNEGEHVPLGDDHVAIPADRLSSEAVERLSGVMLYDLSKFSPEAVELPLEDQTGQGVFVNVDAVYAEVDEWLNEKRRLGHGFPPEDEMDAAIEAAFNDTNHWVRGGINDMGDARYSVCRVNLATGRIAFTDRLRGNVASLMREQE